LSCFFCSQTFINFPISFISSIIDIVLRIIDSTSISLIYSIFYPLLINNLSKMFCWSFRFRLLWFRGRRLRSRFGFNYSLCSCFLFSKSLLFFGCRFFFYG
jgi:hypothetical protein